MQTEDSCLNLHCETSNCWDRNAQEISVNPDQITGKLQSTLDISKSKFISNY